MEISVDSIEQYTNNYQEAMSSHEFHWTEYQIVCDPEKIKNLLVREMAQYENEIWDTLNDVCFLTFPKLHMRG